MRILYTTQFPWEAATTSRLFNFAKEMCRMGEEATLLVTKEEGWAGREHQVVVGEEDTEVDIRYWPKLHEPLSLRLLSSVSWIYFAWKLIRESDIIHLAKTIPTSTISVYLAKILEDKPLVVELDDWDSIGGFASKSKDPLMGKLTLTALEEWIPRHSDMVSVTSSVLYERILDMGIDEERVIHLPIGVNTEEFCPEISGEEIRRTLQLGSSPTIIYVGVMLPEGVEWRLILETIQEIRQEIRDVRLLVVGYGPALSDMKNYARKLQIEDSILFVGGQPHTKIPSYLAAADVAIHILGDEYLIDRARFNTKIVEYMAMSKPIVATDIGEISEALEDGAGLLVKGQSPSDYAEAVKKIFQDSNLKKKLGETARRRAEERYNSKLLSQRLRETYERLI